MVCHCPNAVSSDKYSQDRGENPLDSMLGVSPVSAGTMRGLYTQKMWRHEMWGVYPYF